MPLVTTAVATSPWWLTPAINTTGIGLIMLNDYINRNKVNLNPFKKELDIDDPSIQWRDKTNNFTESLENNVVVDPTLTETTINASPPNNNNNGKKKTNNEDPNKNISGTARWHALSELLGKLTPENKYKEFQVGGKYAPSEEALIDLADQETLYNQKGEYIGGVLPEGDGIDHRATWLHKTRNSPAAQAGVFSDEDRWQTHLANQQWRKDKGRSFTHGDFLN